MTKALGERAGLACLPVHHTTVGLTRWQYAPPAFVPQRSVAERHYQKARSEYVGEMIERVQRKVAAE